MPEQRFRSLGQQLLRAGMPFGATRRLLRELGDHCADIEADLLAGGATRREARREARRRIGGDDAILSSVAAHPELQTAVRQWLPCIAALRGQAIRALFVPERADPRGGALMKWSAAAGLSAVATLALFVLLQVVIAPA